MERKFENSYKPKKKEFFNSAVNIGKMPFIEMNEWAEQGIEERQHDDKTLLNKTDEEQEDHPYTMGTASAGTGAGLGLEWTQVSCKIVKQRINN